MAVSIKPEICPDCGERFPTNYSFYRHASLSPLAIIALLLGILTTLALGGIFLLVLADWVAFAPELAGLRRRDKGGVLALLYAVAVVIALLPALAGWRFAFRLPRVLLPLKCPTCPWVGSGRLFGTN
jgi:hypothetical protein